MTPETIDKLEEVFALGGTDKEACLFANIGMSTLYKYQEEFPEFVDRKEALKQTPLLKARRTIDQSLTTDVNSAWKYAERKDADLNPKQVIDHQTKGEKIDNSDAVRELTQKLNDLHKTNPQPL